MGGRAIYGLACVIALALIAAVVYFFMATPERSEPIRAHQSLAVVSKEEVELRRENSKPAQARLRIRNFEQGSERHFDLDETYAPDSEGQPNYHAAYSLDETEIQLIPSDQNLERNYRFFAVGDGRARRVKVVLHSAISQVLFASSDIFYMANISEDGIYGQIIKYSSPIGARWKLSAEWTTDFYPPHFTGRLSLAQEGELLIAHGNPIPSVLRTSGGEMLGVAPLWNEELHQQLGEQASVGMLKHFQGTGSLLDSGIVRREGLIPSNALIGIFELSDDPSQDIGTPMRLKVLDSENLRHTNQTLEIPSHGFPTACRLADASFVGVSTTAAEIPYQVP